ncbi:MAG: beta-glucosidase BglX [Bacteroidia bacterium]
MRIHTALPLAATGIILSSLTACRPARPDASTPTEARIEALLAQMTLEEKAGQLNLLAGAGAFTGPTLFTVATDRYDSLIRAGKIGGFFNAYGSENLRRLQRVAVEESRLGIPLIVGADVIHGFRTVTPLPLGEAASWDTALIRESAALAAREAAASGINWTFAPMVDIARDARWGRAAEGAGEDPFLASCIAAARVRGFQGSDLADPLTMAACAKHFAAYGAAEGGRDYNTVDMSPWRLRETYLPPFQAAVDAGVATLMNAFNDLDGIPATAHRGLLQDILRDEWGFDGLVVSDWQSILELVAHGYAADLADAGRLAISAGTDVDMMSNIYLDHLPDLVRSGKVEQQVLDQAVRRVLTLKARLGLFDDPYRYLDSARQAAQLRAPAHIATAREIARQSIVLLKNEGPVLPLGPSVQKIALIGPMAEERTEVLGTWAMFGEPDSTVSIAQGLAARFGGTLRTARGTAFWGSDRSGLDEAAQLARWADVVVLALGETTTMNGEAASRTDIGLPAIQMELVQTVARAGKPLVLLVHSGRALDLTALAPMAQAMLATWALGSETGHAIADVLSGDYNPSGKLPVSFPRSVAQAPLYYNAPATGRPYAGDYSEPMGQRVFLSRYIDARNDALYPFGYGLSYTRFELAAPVVAQARIGMGDTLDVQVELRNTGDRAGTEVVQVYVRDLVGSRTRPLRELKAFQKVYLAAGEARTLHFRLTARDLAFWTPAMRFEAEPGQFEVYVGNSSAATQKAVFELVN